MPPKPEDQPRADQPSTARPTVTYKGAVDPSDGTTNIAIQHGGTHPDEDFPLDVPVQTSKTTAKRLADLAGHKFNISPEGA